jgi:hypothetical protein
MTDAELDGKVDWHNRRGLDTTIESRIIRISRGSGTHPKEVKLLLKYHKYFEKMIKVTKAAGSASKQKHIADQIKKNPNAMLNKMNPQVLQQLGGRDAVLNMMQQMKGGTGTGLPGLPPASGMPDMAAMSRMMQQMGMGGQMPDSNAFAQMVCIHHIPMIRFFFFIITIFNINSLFLTNTANGNGWKTMIYIVIIL